MSRWEKLEWVIIFVALLSIWPRMFWPTTFWRALSWVMLGVLAAIFVWRMILFQRRISELDKEDDEGPPLPPGAPRGKS